MRASTASRPDIDDTEITDDGEELDPREAARLLAQSGRAARRAGVPHRALADPPRSGSARDIYKALSDLFGGLGR